MFQTKLLTRALPLLVGAAISFTAAPSANAALVVSIGAQTTEVSPVLLATGSPSVSFTGPFDGWGIQSSATSFPSLNQLINGTTLDVSPSGAGVLHVFMTAQGLTSPTGLASFESEFTSLGMTKNITSVVLNTWVDPGNGLFTLIDPLDTKTFTTIGSATEFGGANVGGGPFSVTAEFTINAIGEGIANSAISVSSVPEASTWAMMILGFLGVGFIAYRKRSDGKQLRLA